MYCVVSVSVCAVCCSLPSRRSTLSYRPCQPAAATTWLRWASLSSCTVSCQWVCVLCAAVCHRGAVHWATGPVSPPPPQPGWDGPVVWVHVLCRVSERAVCCSLPSRRGTLSYRPCQPAAATTWLRWASCLSSCTVSCQWVCCVLQSAIEARYTELQALSARRRHNLVEMGQWSSCTVSCQCVCCVLQSAIEARYTELQALSARRRHNLVEMGQLFEFMYCVMSVSVLCAAVCHRGAVHWATGPVSPPPPQPGWDGPVEFMYCVVSVSECAVCCSLPSRRGTLSYRPCQPAAATTWLRWASCLSSCTVSCQWACCVLQSAIEARYTELQALSARRRHNLVEMGQLFEFMYRVVSVSVLCAAVCHWGAVHWATGPVSPPPPQPGWDGPAVWVHVPCRVSERAVCCSLPSRRGTLSYRPCQPAAATTWLRWASGVHVLCRVSERAVCCSLPSRRGTLSYRPCQPAAATTWLRWASCLSSCTVSCQCVCVLCAAVCHRGAVHWATGPVSPPPPQPVWDGPAVWVHVLCRVSVCAVCCVLQSAIEARYTELQALSARRRHNLVEMGQLFEFMYCVVSVSVCAVCCSLPSRRGTLSYRPCQPAAATTWLRWASCLSSCTVSSQWVCVLYAAVCHRGAVHWATGPVSPPPPQPGWDGPVVWVHVLCRLSECVCCMLQSAIEARYTELQALSARRRHNLIEMGQLFEFMYRVVSVSVLCAAVCHRGAVHWATGPVSPPPPQPGWDGPVVWVHVLCRVSERAVCCSLPSRRGTLSYRPCQPAASTTWLRWASCLSSCTVSCQCVCCVLCAAVCHWGAVHWATGPVSPPPPQPGWDGPVEFMYCVVSVSVLCAAVGHRGSVHWATGPVSPPPPQPGWDGPAVWVHAWGRRGGRLDQGEGGGGRLGRLRHRPGARRGQATYNNARNQDHVIKLGLLMWWAISQSRVERAGSQFREAPPF